MRHRQQQPQALVNTLDTFLNTGQRLCDRSYAAAVLANEALGMHERALALLAAWNAHVAWQGALYGGPPPLELRPHRAAARGADVALTLDAHARRRAEGREPLRGLWG